MTRAHGTKARYVHGPGPGSDRSKGCRCKACTAASREAESRRDRLIVYGQWKPFTDPGPAREHLRMLSANGIGWRQAARLAGLSNGAVSRILYGTATRPATKRIRPETEAAILAVRPSLDVLADSALTDPTGTRRRVQALVARGWTQEKIAGRLGIRRSNLLLLMSRQGSVNAATARATAALYAELENQDPPEGTRWERGAAALARRHAAERGWPPPAAWDDGDIDDPGAGPADGWQRPVQLAGAELAAEARDLEQLGLDRAEAARRLGVTQHKLAHALRLNPEECPDEEEAA